MAILVVGSVAYDTGETPFGRAERVLGGSASFFAVAASFFAPVSLVAVVGDDFGDEELAQVERPRLVACDTMNFWIAGKPAELKKTLEQVDVLLINDAEARELSG